MNFKKNQQGFTLIELLVVIAIIGILTGIVLISVNSVRKNAYDSEIMAELSQIRSAAEVYFGNNGSYSNFNTDPSFTAFSKPACSGGGPYNINISSPNADQFAAYAQLCTDTSQYYCVDSNGNAKKINSAPSDASCP